MAKATIAPSFLDARKRDLTKWRIQTSDSLKDFFEAIKTAREGMQCDNLSNFIRLDVSIRHDDGSQFPCLTLANTTFADHAPYFEVETVIECYNALTQNNRNQIQLGVESAAGEFYFIMDKDACRRFLSSCDADPVAAKAALDASRGSPCLATHESAIRRASVGGSKNWVYYEIAGIFTLNSSIGIDGLTFQPAGTALTVCQDGSGSFCVETRGLKRNLHENFLRMVRELTAREIPGMRVIPCN